MKTRTYGSITAYQQLDILTTLRPKPLKLRWVKPGVRVIDTWTKPVAGESMITILG